MKAVIFAAGEGTRLRPLTHTTPKPLLLINDRPILFRLIDSLPSEINEILIVVSYLADKIVDATVKENFSRSIKFVTMDLNKERGTWSALWQAKSILEDSDDFFLVLNGDDLYSKNDLEAIITNKDWVIGYKKMINPGLKYRNLLINHAGYVAAMPLADENEKLINIVTGAYLLNKEVFLLNPVKTATGEWGLPQTIIQVFDKKAVKAVEMNEWLSINTLADLKTGENYIKYSDNH